MNIYKFPFLIKIPSQRFCGASYLLEAPLQRELPELANPSGSPFYCLSSQSLPPSWITPANSAANHKCLLLISCFKDFTTIDHGEDEIRPTRKPDWNSIQVLWQLVWVNLFCVTLVWTEQHNFCPFSAGAPKFSWIVIL